MSMWGAIAFVLLGWFAAHMDYRRKLNEFQRKNLERESRLTGETHNA